MPFFHYSALDKEGKRVHGNLESANQTTVVAELRRMGLYPLAIDSEEGSPENDSSHMDCSPAQDASTPMQESEKAARLEEAKRIERGDLEALDRNTLLNMETGILRAPGVTLRKGELRLAGVDELCLYFVERAGGGTRIRNLGQVHCFTKVAVKGWLRKRLELTGADGRITVFHYGWFTKSTGLERGAKIIEFERRKAHEEK